MKKKLKSRKNKVFRILVSVFNWSIKNRVMNFTFKFKKKK